MSEVLVAACSPPLAVSLLAVGCFRFKRLSIMIW